MAKERTDEADAYAAQTTVIAETSQLAAGIMSPIEREIHRTRRFGIALTAGIISKMLATVMQLVALPLALQALGTERYAAFLTLQALVAWSGLLGLGLTPSLPPFLARANVAGDRGQQRELIVSSAIFIGMASLALLLSLLLLTSFVSPTSMIAGGPALSAEVDPAYFVIVFVQSASLLLSLVPAIRSGYQELHYSYAWSSIANICVIGLLLWITNGAPTISIFLVALYGPLLVVALLDAGLILWQRPYLAGGRANLWRTAGELGPNAGNVLAAQVSYFALSSVPIMIVAHLTDPTATAAFGSLMQLFMLGWSGMNLIFHPLMAAFANANAHQDWPWMRAIYRRALAILTVACAVIAVVAAASGPQLSYLWLNTDLNMSRALTGTLGLYFGVSMLGLLHFNVLVAVGNLGGVGKAYIIQSVLTVVLGIVLTQAYGATGMAAALAIATLSVTGWYLPRKGLRILFRDDS